MIRKKKHSTILVSQVRSRGATLRNAPARTIYGVATASSTSEAPIDDI